MRARPIHSLITYFVCCLGPCHYFSLLSFPLLCARLKHIVCVHIYMQRIHNIIIEIKMFDCKFTDIWRRHRQYLHIEPSSVMSLTLIFIFRSCHAREIIVRCFHKMPEGKKEHRSNGKLISFAKSGLMLIRISRLDDHNVNDCMPWQQIIHLATVLRVRIY